MSAGDGWVGSLGRRRLGPHLAGQSALGRRGIGGGNSTLRRASANGPTLPRDQHPRVAEVRVAVELSAAQARALREVLERHFHGPIQLDVVLDEAILGGVWVRVEDTVIDGSLRGRLEALRHDLRLQCRYMGPESTLFAPSEKADR